MLTGVQNRTKLQAALRLALFRVRLRKDQVFLDVYGGTGGVTASLKRAGFAVLTFFVCWGGVRPCRPCSCFCCSAGSTLAL